MSGLDKLRMRLSYAGGIKQEDRFIKDKEYSLKKALLYSYQAETAVLADGREFRCLINPDRLKNDYDDKIISIPFKDICLNADKVGKTTEGLQEIGMKAGDVFQWKETETYWLVYLQRLEENAYFRAEIRKCRYEIEIDDKKYKVYLCGPAESSIIWHTKKNMKGSGMTWNDLNYDLTMFVTKDEVTTEFFHRFTKIKIDNKQYEVQAVDNISVDGIIEVALKEYYTNDIEDASEQYKKEQMENETQEPIDENAIYINGPKHVNPYDEVHYSIENQSGGTWEVNNNKVHIISQTDITVELMISTGRSGKFDLIYKKDNEENITLNVIIDSL